MELLNLASGGLIGLLGSLATNGLKLFKAHQEHKQHIEQMKLEAAITREEMKLEGQIRITQANLAAEQAALSGSYKEAATDMDTHGSRLLTFAEFSRRMTRPAITHELIILTGVVYWFGEPLSRQSIADGVVVAAGTAIGWWFGSREFNKSVK
ncbi:hypothetical protein [Gynuella sp.]|uniref:hypothetical protein n=1 Tax=Gynuella sp. TaxID=2969146 RepID=UPI003D10E51A